jgi:hypothetical protein
MVHVESCGYCRGVVVLSDNNDTFGGKRVAEAVGAWRNDHRCKPAPAPRAALTTAPSEGA